VICPVNVQFIFFGNKKPLYFKRLMVGPGGFEPPTSTVSR
jgi:hypothetical protein